MSTATIMWLIFAGVVCIMLALDLGVFHRKAHVMGMREAIVWSIIWILLSLLFGVGIFIAQDGDDALEFFTAYVIEKSLSVDNLFVFLMIFMYFNVPAQYQHRVLYWGILGALVMRAVLILAGIQLLAMFHWVIYVFGGFLIFTAVKFLFQKEHKLKPEKNPVLKLLKKNMPVTDSYSGSHFTARKEGILHATPLLVVLIIIESSDLVFAVDSVPAVLAITNDPFIAYTSNVFAILGLRALYFALAGMLNRFCYLKYALALILGFVGTKMMLTKAYHISVKASLLAIFGILVVSVIASILFPTKEVKHSH